LQCAADFVLEPGWSKRIGQGLEQFDCLHRDSLLFSETKYPTTWLGAPALEWTPLALKQAVAYSRMRSSPMQVSVITRPVSIHIFIGHIT
jgi:hypothetical protein